MHVLLRFPPKQVFQLLADPTVLEEFTKWRVDVDGPLAEGVAWTERRFLRRRRWTVTAYDRRGLRYTAEHRGIRLTMAAKKGGSGSCNVEMKIEGDGRQVARFEKSDGDRLERLRDWLESD